MASCCLALQISSGVSLRKALPLPHSLGRNARTNWQSISKCKTMQKSVFAVRAMKETGSELSASPIEAKPKDVSAELNEIWDWTKTSICPAAYGSLLFSLVLAPILPKYQFSAPFYFMFLSVWAIFVGSHRSLIRKESQEITLEKSWLVPIFCSISLFGFYCLVRFFPGFDIRTFLTSYLNFVGFLAVGSNLVDPFSSLFPSLREIKFKIDLPEWAVSSESDSSSVEVSLSSILAYAVGFLFVVLSWSTGSPFTINNFIAVCIVTELLQLVSLNSFLTAVAMLSGLLIYDVFWVFGSSPIFGDNVMVTVATSNAFDGPVKLIFPQWNPNSSSPYSILGLGDLAAPGLLIALMIRFDRHLHKLKLESTPQLSPVALIQMENDVQNGNLESYPNSKLKDSTLSSLNFESEPNPDKTYFAVAIVSYILGLILTIVINGITGAAQPALLYLVPSLIIGVVSTAIWRNEFHILQQFRDTKK